nr:T9SS type B sorting domain-containing protein [Desulfobacula sp.]
ATKSTVLSPPKQTGGRSPYQYSLNGGAFGNAATFNNLAAGTYSLRVRDANGCEDTESVSLAGGSNPTLSSTTTPPSCNQTNGSITAQATGGRSPYQYSLNGGAFGNTATFNNLAAGTYSLRVRDANGCEDTESVSLSGGSNPTLSSTTTPPSCNQTNGSITAQATGGRSPYQYSLNGGAFGNTATFNNLAAGTYSLRVRDANGCEDTESVSLAGGSNPTLSSTTTQPSCNQTNGSITARATGGRSPYQYSLNGGAFGNAATFNNLAAGTYSLRVRDANGCEANQNVILDNSSDNLTVILAGVVQPTCAGNDGRITVQTTGGEAPLAFSLNGTNFSNTAVFSGLAPGNYNIFVRDAKGCQASASVDLNDPKAGLMNAAISVESNLTQCIGQSLNISGNLPQGTSGQWTAIPSFGVQFANASSRNTNITTSQSGTYTISWTLSTGICQNYSKAQFTLTVPPKPEAENDSVQDVNNDIVVRILDNDITSELVAVSIIENPNSGTVQVRSDNTVLYAPNQGASGNDRFTYQICLTTCPAVCDIATVDLAVGDGVCDLDNVDDRIIFPEGITPNGDGFNDFLKFVIVDEIGCPTNYAKSDISIYNRWNDKVYHQEPYQNAWNGTSNDGKELPPGTYYYALRVRRTNKKDYVRFGHITIFR